jgi:hypothetical protein
MVSLVVLVVLLMVGCRTQYTVNPEGTPSLAGKLEKGQKAYIALALDGKYKDETYAGSGHQVSRYITQALLPYVSSFSVADQLLTFEMMIERAKESEAKYLFIPEITHWEPRAAAWSGRATRLSITLKVYDVETGDVIAINSIAVKGKAKSFVSQHAHELAEIAVVDLVKYFY